MSGSYDARAGDEAARLREQAARLWHEERASLRRLGLGDGQRIVEVGCGAGALLAHLARDFAPTSLVGVDRAPEHLQRAKTVAQVARADGAALPFADGSADVVLFRFVLRHVPSPDALLAEALRVLRPGGAVIAVDADDGSLRFDPEPPSWPGLRAALEQSARRRGGDPAIGPSLRRRLQKAGFTDARAEVLTITTEQVAPPAFIEVFLAPAARPVDADLLDGTAATRAWAELRAWAGGGDALGCVSGWLAGARKPQ